VAFCVFSSNVPVILQWLFIGAFCHKGKFVFLKSTLNSAVFDSLHNKVLEKFNFH
jgi:hypothetical protein